MRGVGSLYTVAAGNKNCAVKRMVSLACLAEHPHANTLRVKASNSRVSPCLRSGGLMCVTTRMVFTLMHALRLGLEVEGDIMHGLPLPAHSEVC
jgi:hypothetical protein